MCIRDSLEGPQAAGAERPVAAAIHPGGGGAVVGLVLTHLAHREHLPAISQGSQTGSRAGQSMVSERDDVRG
eukprot:5805910-Prymnesium_polylepis.1